MITQLVLIYNLFIRVLGLVVVAVLVTAHPALADCPLPPGVTPPADPSVTAQQVEDGSATLMDFALAVRERSREYAQGAASVEQAVYIGCTIRLDDGIWRSGSTYIVSMTPDGRVYIHAKDMALTGRLLNPAVYGAILSALGVSPTDLANLASPDPATVAQAFGAVVSVLQQEPDGAFDATGPIPGLSPGIPGASGHAAVYVEPNLGGAPIVMLMGFDLNESHLVPISDEAIDYGDPAVTARDVVDRESLKAFVTQAGEWFLEIMKSGDASAVTKTRIALRDPNGPWRHGSVYIYVLDLVSNIIIFHAAFPDKYEYRPLIPTVTDAVTGEFILPQVIEAAKDNPEGGFVEYYFDDPNDDTDSADIPKVGYAREFAGEVPRPDGSTVPADFIIGSGFYGRAPAPEGEVVNISTRALVGTGDEVMIGGFIIEDGPRQVLIQARGPELANDGIANPLADPVLTLIRLSDGQELVRNDDWEDSQGSLVRSIWGEFINLTEGSASSALVTTLLPGSYTAKVEGKDGSAGVALVEVYGIDNPDAEGKLVNISTRALVGTGDEVMIGGFIIEDGLQEVLIQALGPELANVGIPNPLADPVLTLIHNDTGETFFVSDDWEDIQGELVRNIWGDFINLADGSTSSALFMRLRPGKYTAKVEGKDGTTGVALVEVYAIDNPGRTVLTALYDALDGANWTRSDNWGTDAPLDLWHGVTADSWDRITRLDLSQNGLSGSIPAEIGDIASLRDLWLFGNELSGEIPAELGNLTHLEDLLLFDNQLSGEIPAEIGNLGNLHTLWLYNNELSGSIPAEIGNLANLESLDLNGNQLIGQIPAEIGNLAGLKDLWLSRNWLNGSIPAELGDLANLEALLLDSNQLTGEIPAELGNLVNLQDLWVSDNQLSGEIPVEIGGLANLQTLLLDGNGLTGELPTELGNLDNLHDLWLSGNPLSGSIPVSLVGTPLVAFWYEETDLCVPADAALREWLDGIEFHEGSGVDCGMN